MSAKAEEDWGVGRFHVNNAAMVIDFNPLISSGRLRLVVKDIKFDSKDNRMTLRSSEQSRFTDTISQYAAVIFDQMNMHVKRDLPPKLAHRAQQAFHYFMISFQKNTLINNTGVHLNKHIVDFCITQD
jgi:hypothetical protein